jgi:multiple sugar transport system permease protein
VLRELGGPSNLLGSPSTALPTTILLDVWEWTPLITLITLAGLASVPKGVIEAASLDGAGYWRRLVHIVLPSISGVVLVALLIRAMDAIRYFDIIWVTTNGGPADSTKIVPLRLYDTAFRFFNFGYAATIGLSMLVVTIVVARIFVTLLQRRGATV